MDPDLAMFRAAFDTNLCNPPLGWDAVRAFESEHGVVLPEPYRTFVAEICDGYAQGPPAYGLLPLEKAAHGLEPLEAAQELAEPFPLTEAWVWEVDARPEEEIGPAIDRVYAHGSLVLGTDGCAMYWHLIVTGPHRGHVWNIADVGAQPFGAEFGYTTGKSGFAGWGAHWAAGNQWWDVG